MTTVGPAGHEPKRSPPSRSSQLQSQQPSIVGRGAVKGNLPGGMKRRFVSRVLLIKPRVLQIEKCKMKNAN